jgi:hypothetical protein
VSLQRALLFVTRSCRVRPAVPQLAACSAYAALVLDDDADTYAAIAVTILFMIGAMAAG